MRKNRYRSEKGDYNYARIIRILTALVLILTIICCVLTVMLIKKGKNVTDSNTSNNASNGQTAVTSSVSSDEQVAMTLAENLDQWYLKLVNKSHILDDNADINTTKIEPKYARDVGMVYDARAVSYLNSMCAAAASDGMSLLVISSFRPHSRQVTLFNRELSEVKAENPGMSENDAIAKASTVVAYPGTSEHEVGLAVDLNSDEETFEQTAEFVWLKDNAEKYGFVLRYPKDKQSITGVIYEPWHYRYVGKENAEKMNQLGYCLEEYIEYLSKYKK